MKGYFRKRGDKWSFSIELGRDPETGKRKQTTVSGFKTKKEAQQAFTEMSLKIQQGTYVKESDITFGEFIRDWLETVARQSVRASTYAGYNSSIHSRLLPAFGHLKLKELKPIQISRFYTSLLDEGISEEFIQYLHSILKNAFSTAMKWGLLQQNIIDIVTRPRRKRKEMRVWSQEQALQFLELTKQARPPYYLLYMLAIFTGMRRGEILALKWSDCMLDEGKISISKSLSYIHGKGITIQETKTGRSNRIISISTTVIEELKRHRLYQQKMKLMLGEAYQDEGYVIAKETGEPVNPNYVFNHFKKWVQKTDLPSIRFHDLRHTHATIMLKLGEHPKVVSERLGHSSIQMTLNVYSHVTPDMQKDASDRFEASMNQTRHSL